MRQPSRNATFVRSALVLVCMLGIMPGRHQASVVTQDIEVVQDTEAYAVYRAALAIKFSSGKRDLTHITLLQETRAGSMECPRDEHIQPEWRSVVERYRIRGRPSSYDAAESHAASLLAIAGEGFVEKRCTNERFPAASIFTSAKDTHLNEVAADATDNHHCKYCRSHAPRNY